MVPFCGVDEISFSFYSLLGHVTDYTSGEAVRFPELLLFLFLFPFLSNFYSMVSGCCRVLVYINGPVRQDHDMIMLIVSS